MSEVILYIAQSKDGYIATPDGGVSWLDKYMNDGEDYNSKFMEEIDINIQGANTYKQILGFDIPYPYKSKTYVITHNELEKPDGAKVEFFQGDLKELVSKAKNESNKNIWLIGGASIVQQFLKDSLIDKMIIFTMPVLLKAGISLFGDSEALSNAKLVKNKTYKSGVVENHYSLLKRSA